MTNEELDEVLGLYDANNEKESVRLCAKKLVEIVYERLQPMTAGTNEAKAVSNYLYSFLDELKTDEPMYGSQFKDDEPMYGSPFRIRLIEDIIGYAEKNMKDILAI